MNTFRWVFVEIYDSFNFVNMRFIVKAMFFLIKIYK